MTLDYAAYLTAFQEELNRKPAGFMPPPAAGGTKSAVATSQTPFSGEKNEAIQVISF